MRCNEMDDYQIAQTFYSTLLQKPEPTENIDLFGGADGPRFDEDKV